MLKHILEWFKDNVGLAILIGIVSIIVLVYGSAKRIGFTANLKIINANQELIDSSYEKYNGIDLKGSEVINVIKRYQDDIAITVCTGDSISTYIGDFKPANNDRKSEKYIKPSQNYTGSLLRNNDKEAIGLLFTKEGVIFTEASYKELLAKIIGVNPEDSTMDSIVKQIDELVKNNNATIAALQQNISSLNANVSILKSQNNLLSDEISKGKKVIAEAISNKGVTTSEKESFAAMASNITKIKSSNECQIIEEKLTPKGFNVRIEHNNKLENGGGKDSIGYYLDRRLNTKCDVEDVFISCGDTNDISYMYTYPIPERDRIYVYKGSDGYCYVRMYADYYRESWGDRITTVSSNYYRNAFYISD